MNISLSFLFLTSFIFVLAGCMVRVEYVAAPPGSYITHLRLLVRMRSLLSQLVWRAGWYAAYDAIFFIHFWYFYTLSKFFQAVWGLLARDWEWTCELFIFCNIFKKPHFLKFLGENRRRFCSSAAPTDGPCRLFCKYEQAKHSASFQSLRYGNLYGNYSAYPFRHILSIFIMSSLGMFG